MALVRHYIPDIIDKILCPKSNQVILCHKIADRHTLVDKSCRRIGVIGCRQHRAPSFLGQLFDRHGNACSLADNDAVCLHLNGAELGLVAVSQDDQIVFLNIILHHIRVGCSHQHLSLVKVGLGISYQKGSLQSFQYVGILGAGLGENAAVIYIHVGSGNISHCDKPLKRIVLRHSRNGHNRIVLHQIPGFFQGNIFVNSLCLTDLNILHLGSHVLNQLRRFHAEIVQHVLSLRVHVSGSGRRIFLPCQDMLEICIADG